MARVPTALTHRQRLDDHRRQAEAVILARQDRATGLLPASTAITVHGDYRHAWVRDNVYSILAVWALGLAYRGVDCVEATRLDTAVVQLMRGLLAAMMRQAGKVERFKQTQDPLDALHAKYDTAHGQTVVGDDAWGHLQIDATAIFVLQLAQMSASGLRIVQRPDEVAFMQNLVYYLAKAWRTPDYGIWERGHKRNEGMAELNASSIGMAKAALEAIDGFEPLPGEAPPVRVVPDDIASARDTLAALLPRESESKETDAALLSIVGYPAFAVDDDALAVRTRTQVLDKLQGRYGCKRFLRDGHQTVPEDHHRLYYTPGELQQFEHIESEWPLFFTYLLVDAALAGDAEEAAGWRGRLDGLMQQRDGQPLLPELYRVPADLLDAERAEPHSQKRKPNENVPLVWAQSLYLVGALLHDGLVRPEDLDPLGRRHARAPRTSVTVHLLPLAEDLLVAQRLAAQGLPAQTEADLAPTRLRDVGQLVAVMADLGRCPSLGLSGRPRHPLGSLVTSQLFVQGAKHSLCLPAFSRPRGFYLALDNRLLADEVAAELATLRRHWRHAASPVLPLLITGTMLDAPGSDVLVQALLALGAAEGVHLGPLTAAASKAVLACRLPDDLYWPAPTQERPLNPATDAVLAWDEAATRPLTPARESAWAGLNDPAELLGPFERSRNPYEQIELLAGLWRCAGPQHDTGLGGDVGQLTAALYARAARERRWGVVRRAAGLLDLHDDALEDAVAEIVVRGLRVSLGRAYSAASVVTRPLPNAELVARLRAHGGDDPRGRVLIQELVLLFGLLIKTEPGLFKGTLTLRPWQSLLLLTGWLAREHGVGQAEALDHVLDLSPHAIVGRLREVITREQEMTANLVRVQSLHATGGALIEIAFPPENDPVLATDAETQGGWLGWREMTGVISRVPEDFHARVWGLLPHCAGLVIGDQLDPACRVDSALALADTTPGERSFALQVDELLNRIHAPEYRQLCIEALMALSDILRANRGLRIGELLVLDVLIGRAVRLGWSQDSGGGAYNEQVAQAWQAFYASPPHRVANLIMAAVTFLLMPPASPETSP